MCGIAGFFNRKSRIDKEPINEMINIIRHRGPDDDGVEYLTMFGQNEENVAIGFVRLSIRDLSMNGHQPMLNDDKSIVLTFNGEIYNADEIRSNLVERGAEFRGTSDTEVILRSYEMDGLEMTLNKINGMYGMAIFDLHNDCIYLVRDRVGEKPLYYYQTDEIFMYASEYKAFYAHPSFTPALNEDGVDEYCIYRYVSDNETLLKNVYSVRPGSYLAISREKITETKYYDIPAYGVRKTKISLNEFEIALKNSVESRMVSDIEVGVQLSGGVDSSIALYDANINRGNLKSFSMIFDNPEYSEERYMKKALDVAGGESNMYKMPKKDYLKALIDTTWHFEAPVNHHGSVQLYYLCKFAKEKVSVILTGEGADELMGGYAWYPVSMFYKRSNPIWKFRTFVHKCKHTDKNYWEDNKAYSENEVFILSDSQTDPCLINNLRPNIDYKKVIKKRSQIYDSCNGEGVEKKLNYEMKTFMVDLLMRQDKVSMASSIECRVPFVDQDIIDYVRKNIAVNDLLNRQAFGTKKQNTKLILKRLAAQIFGDDFAYRKKMGLPSPLVEYFYEEEFAHFMNNVIFPRIKKRKIFNYEYVLECYKKKINLTNVVWRALTFEVWSMIYLDDEGRNVLKYVQTNTI